MAHLTASYTENTSSCEVAHVRFVSSVLAEKGRQVYTTTKVATVSEAVAEMNEKGIGALVVMDGARPVGIFTDVTSSSHRRCGHGPALTHVAEVMTRNR